MRVKCFDMNILYIQQQVFTIIIIHSTGLNLTEVRVTTHYIEIIYLHDVADIIAK